MMKDTISIITTFFDSEKFILQCIDSVNNQIISNDFDVEYILVNDHSTDQSLNIINMYFSKLKNEKINVKILKTPENLGAGGSRKFGIEHSSGNFLMFLDSDDYYIHNDFLLKAYYSIAQNDADIVEFGFCMRNPISLNNINIVSNHRKFIDNDKKENMRSLFLDRVIGLMPWTKIIRKEIIDSHEYSNSRTFDDIETIPYWIYNANKIIIMDSVEVNYRHKLNSTFSNGDNKVRYETVKAMSSLFEYFKNSLYVLKLIYEACLIDMTELFKSEEYFSKTSKLNTYMLSYIYPDTYKNITYDIENDNNK